MVNTPAFHAGIRGFEPRPGHQGLIAQLVEQRIEDPCVDGSSPPKTTILQFKHLSGVFLFIINYNMKKIFKSISLIRIINTKNAKNLTRGLIKQKTEGFTKAEVLARKKNVLTKLVKKAPKTFRANNELRNISYEFKLSFNRGINILLKEHLLESKELAQKLEPIGFNDFSLQRREVVYLKYGNGWFTDVPHLRKIKTKRIKNIILTNKRIIFFFGVHKNSYYLSEIHVAKIMNILLIHDINKKKPTIFLYCKKASKRILLDIQKIKEGETYG